MSAVTAAFRSRQRPLHVRILLSRLENRLLAIAERLVPLRLRECPCCGWSGLHFRSFAVVEYLRQDAVCPGCGAFERHRALWFYYRNFLATFPVRASGVLHFAPETCLAPMLRSVCGEYRTSSYTGEGADLKLDLTHLDLSDDYADVLLMNHVLDCMCDDRAAVREMYRVLRPGGAVLAVVGYQPTGMTVENAVMSNGRYRTYGPEGLKERFAPFEVSVVDAAEIWEPRNRRRNGVAVSVPVLVLRKIAAGARA